MAKFVFHYSDAAFCNGGFRSQQRWRLYRRKHALTIQGQNLLQMLRTEFADSSKLAYIKVDAEGYDPRDSGIDPADSCARGRPVICTEVYRKLMPGERYALYDLLADAGYRVHRYQDGGVLGRAAASQV